MDFATLIQTNEILWSPVTFALLIAVATITTLLAFRPTPSAQAVRSRLDDYLSDEDIVDGGGDLRLPFGQRVVAPAVRRLLRLLARVLPNRNVEEIEQLLIRAGRPAGLTALDFIGLRILLIVLLGGGYFFLVDPGSSFLLVRNSLALAAFGYFAPRFWLKRRVSQRQWNVVRALPDALDMMTIGVEAGLAFESAMYRVGEKWDNALTRELRRAVTEMRVGTPRDVALERMAERLDVEEVSTFVTVLVQSNQLGMSIAQVLHTQADVMREKRRQRAEELARTAGGKMIFPLVFLILPAMFVVLLGPAVPEALYWMRALSQGSP